MVAGSEVIGNLSCRDLGLALPHAREDGNVNIAFTNLSNESFRPLLHFPTLLALSCSLWNLWRGSVADAAHFPCVLSSIAIRRKMYFVENVSPPQLLCQQFRQAS